MSSIKAQMYMYIKCQAPRFLLQYQYNNEDANDITSTAEYREEDTEGEASVYNNEEVRACYGSSCQERSRTPYGLKGKAMTRRLPRCLEPRYMRLFCHGLASARLRISMSGK